MSHSLPDNCICSHPPRFEFEKMTAEIYLPSTALIWPSLYAKLDAYRQQGGQTFFNSLRWFARYGSLIVPNIPLNPTYRDMVNVGQGYQAEINEVMRMNRCGYEEAKNRIFTAGIEHLKETGFVDIDGGRVMKEERSA